MNVKPFRSIFLAGLVLLFSVLVVGQSAWACDEQDKRSCGHHDKWSCDHHDKHCRPPKIEIVYLDFTYDKNYIYFTIWGKNFDNGADLVVTLGGIYDLAVESVSNNGKQIIAKLQAADFVYGDYKLVVSKGHGSKCKDEYWTGDSSECKDAYWARHGSEWKDKCWPRYDFECKDEYCLTVSAPAAAGPQGPPGILGWKIVPQLGDTTKEYGALGTASCGTGYKVTGGGYASTNLNITISGPFGGLDANKNLVVIDNGWYVLGLQTFDTVGALTGIPTLTVYAICACVDPKACPPPTTTP